MGGTSPQRDPGGQWASAWKTLGSGAPAVRGEPAVRGAPAVRGRQQCGGRLQCGGACEKRQSCGPGTAAAPFRDFTNTAFTNTPDTDFTIKENRQWLSDTIESFRSGLPYTVSAVVDGAEVVAPMSGVGTDPSEPRSSPVPLRGSLGPHH